MTHNLLVTHRKTRLAPSTKLTVEDLEARCVLSGNVLQTNLVSDLPGVATIRDANLVNPWGISESSTSPFWIADNGTSLATVYNTAGTPFSTVVKIPTVGNPGTATGTPTGTVFNTTLTSGNPGFVISNGTTSAPATFLFATEDGTIVGWSQTVDPTHGIIAVPNTATPDTGAIYKGLTLATDANGRTLLYAANFHAGTIDVFDTNFHRVTTLPTGAFTDPNLPKGYAPFNVQVLNGKIYVTYALQDADAEDDVSGAHRGFVDVYNLDGSGQQRLISGGVLNSPWGLAIAPSSFGDLAGSLLVGNFGDGRIHAFNITTGALLGELKDPDGEPIQIDGLWALKVGNGGAGGDSGTVYFTAGLDDEKHGLFGSLTPVAPGSPEGLAEAQMLQAKIDIAELDLQAVIDAIANGASAADLKQALKDFRSALNDLRHSEIAFARDLRADLHAALNKPKANGNAIKHALDDIFADIDRLF